MMALASEDLWSKFDLSLDKYASHHRHYVDPFPLSAAPGRSLLLVNNNNNGGWTGCHRREPAASASSPLPTEASMSPLGVSIVPDIRDLITSCGDFNGGGCLEDLADLNMDGGIDMEMDDSLLLLGGPDGGLLDGDETDPLRHDCMWSGGGGGGGGPVDMKPPPIEQQQQLLPACGSFSSSSFADQLLLELGESHQQQLLLLGTSPVTTSSSTAAVVVGRSAPSDLEEEERAVVRVNSRNPAHSDHSYIATTPGSGRSFYSAGNILTPEESSASSSSSEEEEEEEEERFAWQRVTAGATKTTFINEDKATFRVPVLPAVSRLHRNKETRKRFIAADGVAATSSKFRFQIRFKPKGVATAAAGGLRSLLRCHPPSRTCYTRRRNGPADAARLIKDAFYPISSPPQRQHPSLQVRWLIS
jgi:hypothetical protein